MNDDLMELPAGFRFHPTDEELITHYLSKKVLDPDFTAVAIGEVDMNKVEPCDLPWRAKIGEKEWYFFCVRDRKYPTGLRTNRATASGYWKATGKDKEIFRGKNLVGMKKTLVFYQGRAPRGEKSNWVCHEYRLEGKFSLQNLPKTTKSDWVISRVFQKTSGGKKVHISGLVRMNPPANPGELPQLTDHGPFTEVKPEVDSGSGHVHCFSNAMFPAPKAQTQGDFVANFGNPNFTSSSTLPQLESFPAAPAFPWAQFPPVQTGFQYPGSGPIQDPSILQSFLYGSNMDLGFGKEMEMASASQETGMSTENSSAVSNFDVGKKALEEPQDLGCIWNY